jgi:hypothetical protein
MRASLGAQLKRAAEEKGKPVIWLATRIGCSRITVYNWFRGAGVSHAYRPKVERLITQLRK